MLHGSETWSVRKENEVALQRAEMRMVNVKRMCGMKLQDRIPSKGLRERPGLDDNLGTTGKQVAMVWAPLHSTPLTGQAIKPQRQGHIGGPIAQP